MMFSEDGLKIAKLKRSKIRKEEEQTEQVDGLIAEMTEWELSLQTKDIDPEELSRRTKFESNDIIRIVTKDKRDILYRLTEK